MLICLYFGNDKSETCSHLPASYTEYEPTMERSMKTTQNINNQQLHPWMRTVNIVIIYIKCKS
jgi:hypothetical protein